MQIIGMLHQADYSFYTSISWEERDGSKDGIYYTGVISEELDAILGELVSAYNADSSTAEPVSTEDVRYGLTEGIVNATKDENWESPFAEFLRWTKKPADLVYVEDEFHGGVLVHPAGTSAKTEAISNLGFIQNRHVDSALSNRDYLWNLG